MSKKLTINVFINKANQIHDFKYDYSKFKYVNSKTKSIIICCIHDEFVQTPYSHLEGHGCKKCSNIKQTCNTKNYYEREWN